MASKPKSVSVRREKPASTAGKKTKEEKRGQPASRKELARAAAAKKVAAK